jgi:hypothetical protein
MKGRTNCPECGREQLKFKEVVKIGSRRMCRICYRENRKEHRDETRNIRIAGKYADRREKHKRNFELRWDERTCLFDLFIKSGLDEDIAKKKILNLNNYERKLFKRLKLETKNREELNKKFKEKFVKLI